jgi:hypothetical protein
VHAEQRAEGDPHADAEGQGDAVGCVLDVQQDLEGAADPAAHASRLGSWRRSRLGTAK